MSDLDQRTHAPTPKRIRDFRQRGEIALSRDLTMVAAFAGGASCLALFGRASAATLTDLLRTQLAGLETARFDIAAAAFVGAALPLCAGAVLGYVVAAGAQLGFPPAFKAPSFDLTKVFSLGGLKQIFSPMAAVRRVLQSAAKIAVVGIAAAVAVNIEIRHFLDEPAQNAVALGSRLAAALARLTVYGGAALAALAALDYFLTRRQLVRRMRMTPEEMRREAKEQEGDPQVRRRRRQRMRELAKRRLTVAVKTADVVVVNPTHYSVALRYRSGESSAPRVVAKGKDAVAARIRELARSAGVPILSQPPLARLLHKLVPEGREIPANLYQAVAEVLAYVYRLRARRAGK